MGCFSIGYIFFSLAFSLKWFSTFSLYLHQVPALAQLIAFLGLVMPSVFGAGITGEYLLLLNQLSFWPHSFSRDYWIDIVFSNLCCSYSVSPWWQLFWQFAPAFCSQSIFPIYYFVHMPFYFMSFYYIQFSLKHLKKRVTVKHVEFATGQDFFFFPP